MQWLDSLRSAIGSPEDVKKRAHQKGELWAFHKSLLGMDLGRLGLDVVDEGFLASFKIVVPDSDESELEQDVKAYLEKRGLKIPRTLRYSYNSKYSSLLIIPALAGKLFAAQYLARIYHTTLEQSVAMGDDLNDEEMLQKAGYTLTLACASRQIRELVNRQGGMVAAAAKHMGTVQMLDQIRSMVARRTTADSHQDSQV